MSNVKGVTHSDEHRQRCSSPTEHCSTFQLIVVVSWFSNFNIKVHSCCSEKCWFQQYQAAVFSGKKVLVNPLYTTCPRSNMWTIFWGGYANFGLCTKGELRLKPKSSEIKISDGKIVMSNVLISTEDPEHNRHIAGFNWAEHDRLPHQDFWTLG